MKPGKRRHLFQGWTPFRHPGKLTEHSFLALSQNRKRFYDPVTQRRKKLRAAVAQRLQDVGRKLPMMSALLYDHEVVRAAHSTPDLGELGGQHFPEQRAH